MIRTSSGWASPIPRSISSTTLSGALMSFFIFFLSTPSGQRRLDGFLGPVLGPGQSLLPAPVEPLSLLLTHLRLVAAPEPPPILELLPVVPEANREPGEIGRA